MAVGQPNWNPSVVPSKSFSNVYENIQLNCLLVGDRRTCGEGERREDEAPCPTNVQ